MGEVGGSITKRSLRKLGAVKLFWCLDGDHDYPAI